MTDVGLDRADRAIAGALRAQPKGLRERRDFDRVTQRRAGAVRFDVGNRIGVHPGLGVRQRNDFGLTSDAGRGVTDFQRAIIVDRRAANHRVNRVAGGHGLGQPLENHDAHPFPRHRALRVRVEGAAVSIG